MSARRAAVTSRGGDLTAAVLGEVEQQDVAAEAAQVVQGLEVLLQFAVGQLGLQDGGQVAEDVGVQRTGSA